MTEKCGKNKKEWLFLHFKKQKKNNDVNYSSVFQYIIRTNQSKCENNLIYYMKNARSAT